MHVFLHQTREDGGDRDRIILMDSINQSHAAHGLQGTQSFRNIQMNVQDAVSLLRYKYCW